MHSVHNTIEISLAPTNISKRLFDCLIKDVSTHQDLIRRISKYFQVFQGQKSTETHILWFVPNLQHRVIRVQLPSDI